MKERIPQTSISRKNDLGENRKAAEELTAKGFEDGHVSDLYDMNEDASGEKIDLSTGKPIDNAKPDEALSGLTTIKVMPGQKDALPPLEEEDDAAAQFLREEERKAALKKESEND